MNLPGTCWVDSVCQSPRCRAYGYFTHGTAPPPCSFLIWSAVYSQPPSPAVFPNSFGCRFPGRAIFVALVVLHSRPSTDKASLATSLSLIGLFTPVPTGDSASLPEVTHCSSVPCRPSANTLVRRVNETAFAFVVQARPCPAFGRPVHLRGVPPSITARYFSSCPSDSISRWTPCPPEKSWSVASGPPWLVSGFRFRARLGFSIPSSFFGPRGITPAFGYNAPHSSVRGTSTLLNIALLSAHYKAVRP
jgi:hypothetical protein